MRIAQATTSNNQTKATCASAAESNLLVSVHLYLTVEVIVWELFVVQSGLAGWLATRHPVDTRAEMIPHVLHRVVMDIAMAGQNPLEIIIQQLCHRFSLFGPRIPGDAAKRRQRISFGRPCQMISREQEFVCDTGRLRGRACDPVRESQLDPWSRSIGSVAFNHSFEAESFCSIGGVHHSATTKLFSKPFMVADVVTMRQEHFFNSAEPLRFVLRVAWQNVANRSGCYRPHRLVVLSNSSRRRRLIPR